VTNGFLNLSGYNGYSSLSDLISFWNVENTTTDGLRDIHNSRFNLSVVLGDIRNVTSNCVFGDCIKLINASNTNKLNLTGQAFDNTDSPSFTLSFWFRYEPFDSSSGLVIIGRGTQGSSTFYQVSIIIDTPLFLAIIITTMILLNTLPHQKNFKLKRVPRIIVPKNIL